MNTKQTATTGDESPKKRQRIHCFTDGAVAKHPTRHGSATWQHAPPSLSVTPQLVPMHTHRLQAKAHNSANQHYWRELCVIPLLVVSVCCLAVVAGVGCRQCFPEIVIPNNIN